MLLPRNGAKWKRRLRHLRGREWAKVVVAAAAVVMVVVLVVCGGDVVILCYLPRS